MTAAQLSANAQAVMAVMRAAEAQPYLDRIARDTGLPDHTFKLAIDELVGNGLATRCTAPGGVLLYPTLRGMQLLAQP